MKNVIIIGATTGIGYVLARQYAAEGWQVGATGRRLQLLEELQQHDPARIHIRQHDVTSPDQLQVLDSLVAAMGSAQLIVYNSGVGIYNKDLTAEPELTTIDVNIKGFTETMVWAWHHLEKNGGGQIAGISSVAAFRGSRLSPAYGASKAYMVNFMEALRQKARNGKHNIWITDIRPGFVDTPMTKQNKGMFWVASPEKACRQIRHSIHQKARVGYITRRWRMVALLIRNIPAWLWEKN